jgi:anti-sigma factor RsiW
MSPRLRFWSRRELVCRDAVALVGEYLEGRLSTRDAARLEGHLAACPHCAEYLAQMRATIDALGRVEPEALPDDVLDDLVGVYRAWQRE